MKVVHVASPLARVGGPPGLLLELETAFARTGTGAHTVVMPPRAPVRPGPRAPGVPDRIRAVLRRAKRRMFGPPSQYRPPLAELREPHGRVERLMKQTSGECVARAEASLVAARTGDLLIAHELPLAERLLETRAPGQQVWMFVHIPMPVALYFVWNWGVPEQDWREIVSWPDVKAWIDRELAVWAAVDRVVTPTPEALDELVRVDERFRSASRMDYVLSGGAAPVSPSTRTKLEVRKAWRLPFDQPVGLYLGNTLPYRGFDRLVAGLDRLSDTRALPGTIAVAGPTPAAVPPHDRIRALGPVRDVGELMGAVDFFVNVNRFNLFDLSIIEACQAGLPMLMHMTGGNRTVAALGAGHVPVSDLSDGAVARGLEELFSMPSDQRRALGRQSRAVYDTHLTPAHMAERYNALHDRACAERTA